MSERLSWTQAICGRCWNEREPDRPFDPTRDGEGPAEVCGYCGRITLSGIYVRDDPATVPYLRPKDD